MTEETIESAQEQQGRTYSPRNLLGTWLVAVLSAGCTLEGSGEIEERDFSVEAFDEVIINGGFYATIEQGKKHAVTVRADDNLMDHVQVQSGDGILHVEMGKHFGSGTLEVKLVMPELRAAKVEASMLEGRGISAADDLRLEAADSGYYELSLAPGEELDSLTIEARGASNMILTGYDTDAGKLRLNNSTVHLEGTAQTLQANIIDSSTLTGRFESKEIDFVVRGDSEGYFSAEEKVKGEASERAHVSVSGDATIDVEVSEDSNFAHEDE